MAIKHYSEHQGVISILSKWEYKPGSDYAFSSRERLEIHISDEGEVDIQTTTQSGFQQLMSLLLEGLSLGNIKQAFKTVSEETCTPMPLLKKNCPKEVLKSLAQEEKKAIKKILSSPPFAPKGIATIKREIYAKIAELFEEHGLSNVIWRVFDQKTKAKKQPVASPLHIK